MSSENPRHSYAILAHSRAPVGTASAGVRYGILVRHGTASPASLAKMQGSLVKFGGGG